MSVSLIFIILINASVDVYAKEIKGKNSSDILEGTNKNDIIRGYNGNDNITGLKGNDLLFGNNGSDTLEGGSGADIFDCGRGIDNVIDYNLLERDTLLGNCEISNKMDNDTNQSNLGIESGTAILVTTDKAKYGSGDTIKIEGQVNTISQSNMSQSLLYLINIKISRIAEEKPILEKDIPAIFPFINIKISRIAEEKPTLEKDVSVLSDAMGKYHLDFTPTKDGKYIVSVTTPNNSNLTKFTQFEVNNIFNTETASMLRIAGICFFILLAVIIAGSYISHKIDEDSRKEGEDIAWKKAHPRITIIESLRLLLITGIAIFSVLSLLFADTEIGVNAPIGLVKKNATGIISSQNTTAITQNGTQWVFNIGGTNLDNYRTGIQIPTYIVIFGLLGGYFRFLYGMRFLFSEKGRKEPFYDTDKRWGDINVKDPLSFLMHSLRSLSLFFLSPFVAVGVWLIFVQVGTTGFWVGAAGSFTMGLITEEVILTLISFARTLLVGIRESSFFPSMGTREEKEKPKPYRTTPNDKSTGVSPNQQVSIEYDEVISKDSAINNFKLSENGTNLSGNVELVDPKSIMFTPRNLLSPNKTYTAKIESGIFDLHHNEAEPIIWTFTTRRLPILTNRIPKPDESVPHTNIIIELSFNQMVKSDNDSIRVERVTAGQPAALLPGTTRDKPGDERTIFFELQPGTTFDAANKYRITLSNIRDSADNELQPNKDWTWEFDAT